MKNKSKLFYNALIALYPYLAVYAVPGMASMGINELLALLFSLIYLARNKRIKISVKNGWYCIFIVYSIIESFLMILFVEQASIIDTFNRLGRNLLQFVLIALLAESLFDIRIFAKVYMVAGGISSIFLIIQNVLYLNSGIIIPWLIPKLKLQYTIANQSDYYAHYIRKYYHYGQSIRATGGFSEPTTFSAYVLPLLAMILIFKGYKHDVWEKNKKIMVIVASCITVAIILSTSATGMVGVIAIYLIYFWKYSKKNRWILALFPIIIAIAIVGGIYFIQTNAQMQSLMTRLTELNSIAGASSGNQRVVRGYAVWMKLPIIMKIFGTGFGNISSTILTYNISTPFDPYFGSAYMNAIAELLVSCGVVGFFLFLIYFSKIVKKKTGNIAELIAVFGVMMASINMLASAGFVTIMIVISQIKFEKKDSGLITENV